MAYLLELTNYCEYSERTCPLTPPQRGRSPRPAKDRRPGPTDKQGAGKWDGSGVRAGVHASSPWLDVLTETHAGRAGTIRIASPSRTGLPPTVQTQSKRARRFAGNNSASVTLAITSSPIRTGPLKFSVCEM